MRFLRFSFVLIFIFSNIFAPFSVWAEEVAIQEPVQDSTIQTDSIDVPASTTDEQIIETTTKESPEVKTEEKKEDNQEIANSNEQNPISSNQYKNSIDKKNILKVDELTGALRYSYSFSLPSGITNFSPELSLSYNSELKDNASIVGYGWELSIPYISRVNKHGSNELYSERHRDFTSSLSGELIEISSNKYHSKIEDGEFTDYSFENNIWIAKTKSGILYTFGLSEADRQDDVAHRNVSKWMLSSIKDTNDNEIKFTYFKDKGQIYPDHISYAGIYDISFIKELRSDSNSSYATAFSVKTDYRISGIVVKVNKTETKKYDFLYTIGDNGNRSLLSSIVENNKEILPKTISFDYNKSNAGWEYDQSQEWSTPKVFRTYLQGLSDVDGDSWPDIYESHDCCDPNIQIEQKNIYINNKKKSWILKEDMDIPVLFFDYEIRGGTARDLWEQGVRLSDINGDLLPDILKTEEETFQGHNYQNPGGRGAYLNVRGEFWQEDNAWVPLADFTGDDNMHDFGTYLADLNGDGLLDVFRKQDQNKSVELNTGRGFESKSETWLPPDPVELRILLSRLTDLNNDGLIDVVFECKCDNFSIEKTKKTYLNRGDGTWQLDNSWLLEPMNLEMSGQNSGIIFLDVNSDGLQDAVPQYTSLKYDGWGTYINTGNGWRYSKEWNVPEGINFSTTDLLALMADLNADGSVDFLGNEDIHRDTPLTKFWKNKTNTPVDVLKTVNSSIGGSVEISYKKSSAYIDDNGDLLNSSLPASISTVEKIVTIDPVNNIQSTETYKYKDGRFYFDQSNPFDRKFAGFGLVEKNENDQRITKTYYHTGGSPSEVEYHKIGKVYKTEVLDNTGKLYQRTLNKWDTADLGNGSKFVKLSQTINETYDDTPNHRDTATEYFYDNVNGNILKQINYGEVVSNIDGTFSDLVDDASVTAYDYSTNDAKSIWKLKTETLTPKNSKVNLREKRYWYDGLPLGQISKGNTTREDIWTGGSFYAGTKYEYDSYGNVTKVIDPMNSSVSYKYDAYNIFPVSMINALGHETLYEYDYLAQKPSKVIDANGNSIYYKYDSLGRVLEERIYDGSLKASYVYVDTPNNVSVEKTNYLSDGLYVKSYIYFDGLGRKIQEKSSAENNQWITKDYVYNEMGYVAKESLPYLSSSSSKTSPTQNTNIYTNISYDIIGRPIQTSNVIGSSSILYNNWNTIYTDMNGNKKEEKRDARGNITEVVEHNNGETYVTKYTYSLAGDRLKVIGSKDNVINYTYDKRGLKLSEEESHTANATNYSTFRYEYDANGRMIKKTDLKAETTSYFYDKLNRMTSEVSAKGDTMSLYYDENQNGKGNLTKIENGIFSKKIFYNPLALPEKEEFTKNSQLYTFSYFYDIQGNLLRFINSDLSEVRNTYNTLGRIEKIETKTKDGEYVNIVNNFDYAPTGLISLIENANGTKTENIYSPDDLYRLKQKLVTNSSETTSLPVQENSKSFSLASDGSVYIHSNSWNTDYAKRTGAGVVESNLFEVKTGRTKDKYRVERGFLAFDTSSIPDRAEILSAKVTLYVESRQNPANDTLDYVSLFPSSQKDTNTLAKEDYQNIGSVELSDKKDITNIKAKNFISFSVNAEGLKNIDKAGITKFSLREGHDVSNTDPKLSPSKYSGVTFRSSAYEGTQYDPIIEITYTHSLPNPKIIESYSYTYDKVGNILEIKDESELSPSITAYAYDDLYRLISAKRSNKEGKEIYSQTYTYDSLGNILNKGDKTYSYTNINPFQATKIGDTTYLYDKNGNMIDDSSYTHTYDHKNQLIESIQKGVNKKVTYTYDNTGQRYTYTTSDNEITYFNKYYNLDKELTPTKHIYNGDTLIATQEGEEIRYINTDHLGSTTSITNEKGEVIEKTTYYPYGTILSNDTYTFFDEQRKYTGHEYDIDTDLTYANARYYDQDTGRFLSQDPLIFNMPESYILDPQQQNSGRTMGGLNSVSAFGWRKNTQSRAGSMSGWAEFLADPQMQNSYSYGRNNPITMSDPDGRFAVQAIATLVGAAGGFVSQYVSDVSSNINNGESNIFTHVSSPGTYATSIGRGALVGLAASLGGVGAGAITAMGTSAGIDYYKGNKVDFGGVALDGAVTLGTGGLVSSFGKVVGREPGMFTQAFFSGKHTQAELVKEAIGVGTQHITNAVSSFVKSINNKK